jgi:hypothetical protein
MSGEYRGWCTCGTWRVAKNRYTSLAKCTDAIFFAIYGNLYHRNGLVFLNKNAGLQFAFVKSINGAQYVFDRKKP